jgi:hypothetical protein
MHLAAMIGGTFTWLTYMLQNMPHKLKPLPVKICFMHLKIAAYDIQYVLRAGVK